ncbi:MAG TPA: hypothetical protein VGV85_09165, partial [Longimicrobiaceae bacterium]|nr:hypothetical protein [Longimicrobiaceae bacterium]
APRFAMRLPEHRLRFLALVFLAGCAGGATGPDEPASGSFALRAVRPQAGIELAVPAAYATGTGGDSVRVLGGAFTLEGTSWSVRFEQELVARGGEVRPRVLEERGSFAVTEAGGGRRVLDLYPGRPVTADRPWTAVLAGDTVHYGPGVFVR